MNEPPKLLAEKKNMQNCSEAQAIDEEKIPKGIERSWNWQVEATQTGHEQNCQNTKGTTDYTTNQEFIQLYFHEEAKKERKANAVAHTSWRNCKFEVASTYIPNSPFPAPPPNTKTPQESFVHCVTRCDVSLAGRKVHADVKNRRDTLLSKRRNWN